jgi:hypothetical protein
VLDVLAHLGVEPARIASVTVRAAPAVELPGEDLRRGRAGLWLKVNKRGRWRIAHRAAPAAAPAPLAGVVGLDVRLR